MKVAIEGCAHGELDNIYESIKALESEENIKVDLLICCGDFQSVRNENDLRCMAIPPKYYDMGTFYKYYSGEKEVPVLTIFIGGNHEASNYLQELPYGGWVAPNIYYMGYGGVVNVGGLRIGGLSGIYKPKDYMKGHYEMTPYSDDSKRSVYHIRNVEVFRLKQLSGTVDIFLSHDWPQNITNHGNAEQLIRYKPFLKEDIQSGKLGSPPATEILQTIKPNYWFSAHLHCKFAALVEHDDGSMTKFLALDKCLPSNRFLQIWDFPSDSHKDIEVSYDLEWLTILFLTNHLFSVKSTTQYMPTKLSGDRYNFTPTESEMEETLAKFKNELIIPNNFNITAESYAPSSPSRMKVYQPPPKINNQTTEFCSKLGIIDPSEILIQLNGSLDLSQLSHVSEPSMNLSQTFIEDSDMSKEMDTSTSPVKRMSLVLPKPVNEEKDCDEEAADAAVNLSRDSNYLVEGEPSQSTENPKTKKLKRRNADIYENQED